MSKVYVGHKVSGDVVTAKSLKEIADIEKVSRISKKQAESLGYHLVEDSEVEKVSVDTAPQITCLPAALPIDVLEMGRQQVAAAMTAPTEDTFGYPRVGTFKERKDLQAYYKNLSVEQLEEWVLMEGMNVTYTESQPIYRMRLAMSILFLHFPKKPSTPKKKAGKYSKYSTEELVKLASEHKLEIKDSKGDSRIQRMYCIMALRKEGVIA